MVRKVRGSVMGYGRVRRESRRARVLGSARDWPGKNPGEPGGAVGEFGLALFDLTRSPPSSSLNHSAVDPRPNSNSQKDRLTQPPPNWPPLALSPRTSLSSSSSPAPSPSPSGPLPPPSLAAPSSSSKLSASPSSGPERPAGSCWEAEGSSSRGRRSGGGGVGNRGAGERGMVRMRRAS